MGPVIRLGVLRSCCASLLCVVGVVLPHLLVVAYDEVLWSCGATVGIFFCVLGAVVGCCFPSALLWCRGWLVDCCFSSAVMLLLVCCRGCLIVPSIRWLLLRKCRGVVVQ